MATVTATRTVTGVCVSLTLEEARWLMHALAHASNNAADPKMRQAARDLRDDLLTALPAPASLTEESPQR